MNFYGAKEMADSFLTVRKNTIIIAQDIPDEHYGFRPTPESRSVAQLLTHIAIVPQLQEEIHAIEKRTTLEGFDFPGFMMRMMEDEQTARPKDKIIELLQTEGDRFGGWLGSVSDEFLAERVAMPAGMVAAGKTRFEMLLGLKEHEMHHRAQLMLMERLLGIVPHFTRQMQARFAEMAKAQQPAGQ
jgi:uncharacterized damage-inducible protein DinB